MYFRYSIFTLLFCFGIGGVYAQPIKKLKNEAEEYLKYKKYEEALQIFENIKLRKPDDLDNRLNIGYCLYQLHDLTKAQKYLQYVLDNDKSPSADLYLCLGKTYHASLQFQEAVKYYKFFLKNTKKNDARRSGIKNAIRRCASGMRISVLDQYAFVENLGNKVNSKLDDFGPVLSPNYDNKIYFTASRPGNLGDLRNKEGFRDPKYGHYNTDMFATVVINGEWTATTPLNSLINSSRHDMVLGFDAQGTMLYYFKGPSLFSGEILVDTFRAADERALVPDHFTSPMATEEGDGAPQFFNDSVLVFSSRRPGGYGGSDLYLATTRNGKWQAPQNLGPTINSAYDETTPFLSVDGRTLYFSSNNINSIGDLDIFKSKFDDVSEQWSTPVNMGIPINSAGEDAYFKLSKDGLKGYFSSSRKDGLGQRDLFVAYFKNVQSEQKNHSNPNIFAKVREYKRRQGDSGLVIATPNNGEGTISTLPGVPQFSEEEIINVEISNIFYTKDDKVITPTSTIELNKVARLMKDFPQLKLVMDSHSDGNAPPAFDLYFSAKRAEKAAQYLVENGVNPANIIIKGCGANYPIALNELESGVNEIGQRLNRRIELNLENSTGLPLRISNKDPRVSKYMAHEMGKYYQGATNGLSYKVQIASIQQMYNGELLTRYPDPMVETNAKGEGYQYTVGLYQTYSSAEQLQRDLARQGVTDAFVVPYINGIRVSRDDSKVYAAAYPDLLNFLEYSKTD